MDGREQTASRIDAVARSKGWTVEAILADPYQAKLFDHLGREFLTQNRSRLEVGLLQKARIAGGGDRLQIGILLLEMGASGGSALVLDALADPDPAVVRNALSFCRHARWQAEKGLLVPLDQPKAAAALLPFVSAADPGTRLTAVEAICRLSDEGAVERLARLLTHEEPNVRAEVALHLASYHGDSRAWPIVQSLFSTARPHGRYRAVNSLRGFALNKDQHVREQVAALVRRELGRLYDHADNDTANEAFNLMRVLERLVPDWERDVLREILASKMAAWVKASAAERLALTEEASVAEQHVLAWLDHPELADYAPEIVCKLGAKANTPAIAARLRAELASGVTGKRFEKLLDAFVAIRAVDDADLRCFLDRVDGWRRFDFTLRSKHITADAMLKLLDRAELIPMARSEIRAQFVEKWWNADRFGTIVELLAGGGRFHVFDCEDANVPPDYPSLVGELAALSDGEILAGRVAMSVKEPAEVQLRIDADSREALLTLQYQGDWIDVDGLLSGLNRLLAKIKSPRRFYVLQAAGQWVMVVLAQAEAMSLLVSDYAFPIGDPGEARRLGQAYEAQVVGKG